TETDARGAAIVPRGRILGIRSHRIAERELRLFETPVAVERQTLVEVRGRRRRARGREKREGSEYEANERSVHGESPPSLGRRISSATAPKLRKRSLAK